MGRQEYSELSNSRDTDFIDSGHRHEPILGIGLDVANPPGRAERVETDCLMQATQAKYLIASCETKRRPASLGRWLPIC
jgi:hypothetical protein